MTVLKHAPLHICYLTEFDRSKLNRMGAGRVSHKILGPWGAARFGKPFPRMSHCAEFRHCRWIGVRMGPKNFGEAEASLLGMGAWLALRNMFLPVPTRVTLPNLVGLLGLAETVWA